MRARKRFGQHFLERAWVRKVIDAIDPKADETFVEIGPGHGALTRPLAARARQVIACEIDRDLVAELRASMPPNVTVVAGDFLEADIESCVPRSETLRVAGNLPYNVASPILFKLVSWSRAGVPLSDATLMLQREVADRLAAEPGSRDYGVLSVLIRHRADVKRLLTLPPGAFRPPPKVRSAVVRLRFHPPDPPVADERAFARLVQRAFTHRRKTLANALRGDGPGTEAPPSGDGPGTEVSPSPDLLAAAGIDGRRRPETLSIAEFARLADGLRN